MNNINLAYMNYVTCERVDHVAKQNWDLYNNNIVASTN